MKLCCKNIDNTKNLSQTVNFLKVIAEENRLKILCFLKSKEKCVCEIWQFIDLPQNLVSHHLKVLKDFGLVSYRKDGLKVYYSVNKSNLQKYNLLLNNFFQTYEK